MIFLCRSSLDLKIECRFSDVSEDDIEQLNKNAGNKKMSTKWAVNAFEEWRKA